MTGRGNDDDRRAEAGSVDDPDRDVDDPPNRGSPTSDRGLERRAVVGIVLLGVVSVGGVAAFLLRRQGVLTAASLEAFLEATGPYAPVVFVGVQALQVIVAPIPGQILAGVGGYLFGRVPGTVYSMTGVVIGSYVVFVLARRYGRSAVLRLLDEDLVTRFERFGEKNGRLTLFAFFLLPTFPDDALCALAGLWPIGTRTFLVLLVVGRAPSFLLAAHAGTSLESGALGEVGIVLTGLVLVFLAVYVGRDRIEAALGPDESTENAPDT
jgi:uncharacterized membrane protein YdjX (TVP38/TMEM64 family)